MLKSIFVMPALIIAACLSSCSHTKKINGELNPNVVPSNNKDDFFTNLFRENPGIFDSIVANKNNWNVQVLYTPVNRNRNYVAALGPTRTFNINDKYFYPASTVKLPIALLSLQKLNQFNNKNIDKHTTMLTEAAFSGQTPVYNDPTSPDGRPTIAHYIKKLFLVSDNDASNRLYEFLGQEYLNNELHKRGYGEAQILHRLAIFLSEAENRHTNPVSFYDSTGKLIYNQPMQVNKVQYETRKDSLGTGYFTNGKLVNTPMNFSKKNKISLNTLHQILISVVYPSKVKASRRFNLTEDDRKFVLTHMSKFPGESAFPAYDINEHYDGYAKFLYYGSEKGALPKSMRIFNKVGNAYGQLVDVAYVVDFDKKIEFFLSAAITCNTDGILNDDKYDYNTIGLPFLKNLGRAVYEHEIKRPRRYAPDLTELRFSYDK